MRHQLSEQFAIMPCVRLILLLLPGLLSCLLLASRPSPGSELPADAPVVSAAELVQRVITAYGGLDKLKQNHDGPYHAHGHISYTSGISGASNALVCDIYSLGDKLRVETNALGQRIVLAYDGKQAWTQMGDWAKPASATECKRIAEDASHGIESLIEATKPDVRVELAEPRSIEGVDCQSLKIFAADGKPTTLYIDPKSSLVLQSEYQGTDEELGTPALKASQYFDYKPVDGCQSAYRIVEFSNGRKTQESVFDSFEKDASITASLFAFPQNLASTDTKDMSVVVPFRYSNNQIIVKVGLNGKGFYDFILDTGASQCLIDKAAASAIGHYSNESFNVTSASKAIPLNFTTLSQVEIGSVKLHNVSALVTDLSVFKPAFGETPAGLLGANVLSRFLITIDYKNKQLILSDPHKVSIPQGAFIIKASPTFGASTLVVSGKLNNKKTMNFLVDTGAAFSTLPAAVAKSYLQGNATSVGQMFGIDGKKVNIGLLKAKTLQIGSLIMNDQAFAVAPDAGIGPTSGLFGASSLGILGNPTWAPYKLTVDYVNERLILLPQTTQNQPAPAKFSKPAPAANKAPVAKLRKAATRAQ